MLSCLAPHFGQPQGDDKIMSTKFALQFPALADGLRKSDNEDHSRIEAFIHSNNSVKQEETSNSSPPPMSEFRYNGDANSARSCSPADAMSMSTSSTPGIGGGGSAGDGIGETDGGRLLIAAAAASSSPHDTNRRTSPPPPTFATFHQHLEAAGGLPRACSNSSASSFQHVPLHHHHHHQQSHDNFLGGISAKQHESMHQSPNSNISCHICGKHFANVYRLQRHMLSHDESDGLRKFKCTNCDKAFKFKHHLKEHLRIHSGEKPFSCNNCGKRFSHSGSFSSHMTSKKCISLGLLKSTNPPFVCGTDLHTNAAKQQQHLSPNSKLDNNQVVPPINPGFMPHMLHMSHMMPFSPFLPTLNPSTFSIQKLLEHTEVMNSLLKSTQNNNNEIMKSESPNMIEEVPEEEPRLMIDEDHEKTPPSTTTVSRSPSPPPLPSNKYRSILDQMSEQWLRAKRARSQSPQQTTTNDEAEKVETLKCGRCSATFNHPTELVQHEKMLCNFQKDANLPPPTAVASGSETDNDDRESKMSSESDRKVRVRTAISEEQQQVLKEHYSVNPRPSREDFKAIANRLGLDARVVQVWFQNNRSRERKLSTNPGVKATTTAVHSSPTQAPAPPPQLPPPVPAILEQPLDLSIKKEIPPSVSPRYGTAPQQQQQQQLEDQAINLSKSIQPPFYLQNGFTSSDFMLRQIPSPSEAAPRQSRPSPYLMPNNTLGMVPMERLFSFTPEMARNPFLIKPERRSLSPGGASDKRSWKDDDSRISFDDDGKTHIPKRLYASSDIKEPPNAEGMYVCDLCDKAFHKQSSLARHKYEHSGQRPYKCIECPKAFKHKHHLTEHKRLHTGEKPFQCCKCLKKFSHSGSYSQHMNHRYSYCKPYRE